MTIAAFRKPSLSVGARVVFGSALLLARAGRAGLPGRIADRRCRAPRRRCAAPRDASCGASPTTRPSSWSRAKPGAPDNQHPWTVEPNTLHAWLQQVQVMRSGAAKPLFAIDELNNIVPAIAEALAHARPDQDIALVSSARHEDNTFYSITAVTARLFVVDGHLNLIVHDARVDFYDAARGSGMAPHFTVGSRTPTARRRCRAPARRTSAPTGWCWARVRAARGAAAPALRGAPAHRAAPVAPAAPADGPWRRPPRRSRRPRRRRPPAPPAAAGAPAAPRRRRRRAAPAHDQAPLRQGPDHQVRVREEARGDHQGAVSAAPAPAVERLQRERVGGGRAGGGVVEDDPGHGRRPARRPARAACCASQRVVVARPVHARRAVPAVVQQGAGAVAGRAQPAAGARRLRAGAPDRRPRATTRSRASARSARRLEPARVARLAGHRAVPATRAAAPKNARATRASQASDGGSCTSSTPSRSPRPAAWARKARSGCARGAQARVVRDRARELHREAEVRRRHGGPARVGLDAVRAVERRVDLGAGEAARVALEVLAVAGKCGRDLAREAPGGGADVHGMPVVRPGDVGCRPGPASPRLVAAPAWCGGATKENAPDRRSEARKDGRRA